MDNHSVFFKGDPMGKKSLIKSTDKKKDESQKKETSAKKSTPKKSTATTKKTTKESTPAKKASPPKKITAKKTTAKKSVKAATIKELIFKQFEPLTKQPAPAPAPTTQSAIPDAPEWIASDDPQERKRLRALLAAKFSMADIKASAKAPEPQAAPEKVKQPELSAEKPATPPAADTVSTAPSSSAADVSQPVAPQKTAPAKPSMAPETSFDIGLPETDPVKKMLKYGIVAVVVLFLLLVGASFKNSSKYYIVTQKDAIEIWRGRFSPTGRQRLILLHGVSAPGDSDAVYSKNHIFPLIFQYYLDKADAFLEVQEIPDYEMIKDYLAKAEAYAVNTEMKDDITVRRNNIDLITLLYKIDVSIRKGTAESLDQAAQLVKKAGRLTTHAAQSQLLADKTAEIKERRAALEAAEAEAAAAQADESGNREESSAHD